MRAPAFWWQPRRSGVARLLWPLGAFVGAFASSRMRRRGFRARVPVVCVGNFVAGGAGKTPAAIAIARHFLAAGERPFFLSRGYGGRLGKRPILVDPNRHDARDVGDEPLLLARVAPCVVARRRPAGARLAAKQGATIIVMDDGLQSRQVEPDFALAVVDGGSGIGNGLCLPAGPLRAPLRAQLRHVDAVLVVGSGAAGDAVAARAAKRRVAVLRGTLISGDESIDSIGTRPVFAFAGIGRPEKFFATLRQAGVSVAKTRAFADHHRFTPSDLFALELDAAAEQLVLLTTEKDFVRLPKGSTIQAWPVDLKMADEALATLLSRAIERKRRGRQ